MTALMLFKYCTSHEIVLIYASYSDLEICPFLSELLVTQLKYVKICAMGFSPALPGSIGCGMDSL